MSLSPQNMKATSHNIIGSEPSLVIRNRQTVSVYFERVYDTIETCGSLVVKAHATSRRPEPLLFLSSSSSVVLRHTTQKSW
jgi:hypothetical protein